MVIHFLNLVSWRNLSEQDLSNSKFYFDSLSIVLLCNALGYKLTKRAGVDFLKDVYFDSNDLLLLSSENNIKNNFVNYHILPWFEKVDENAIAYIDSLIDRDYKRIFFGISSPKQDLIAIKIQNNFSSTDFYCLGAAFDNIKGRSIFHNLNIHWINFLFSNPKRTFVKIYITLKEIFLILILSRHRSKFISFINSINKHV